MEEPRSHKTANTTPLHRSTNLSDLIPDSNSSRSIYPIIGANINFDKASMADALESFLSSLLFMTFRLVRDKLH